MPRVRVADGVMRASEPLLLLLPPISALQIFANLGLKGPSAIPGVSKEQLVADVAAALYASKICSYAQVGLRIKEIERLREASCRSDGVERQG